MGELQGGRYGVTNFIDEFAMITKLVYITTTFGYAIGFDDDSDEADSMEDDDVDSEDLSDIEYVRFFYFTP